MTLVPGTRFGAYEIVAPLGAGGMGVVYRARDVRLNRDIALKFLSEKSVANPSAVARFRFEAQAASALNHPHILTRVAHRRSGVVARRPLDPLRPVRLSGRRCPGRGPVSPGRVMRRRSAPCRIAPIRQSP
jgi:hypothetical protein